MCSKIYISSFQFFFYLLPISEPLSLSSSLSPDLTTHFQAALVIKSPPANAGDASNMGQSLGQEDPLKEDLATHSHILAWRIPWTEKHGGLYSIGLQRVGHNWSNLEHNITWVLETVSIETKTNVLSPFYDKGMLKFKISSLTNQ